MSEYFSVAARRWRIIALAVSATLISVVVGANRMAPTFTSEATLRVSPAAGVGQEYRLDYADRLMNTLAHLAATRPVLEELTRSLDLAELPDVGTEIVANTELIRVQAEHRDATTAAAIANGLAGALEQQARSWFAIPPDAQLVSVVEPAQVSRLPTSPNLFLLFPLALTVALVGGLGLGFLAESLDKTVRDEPQVESLTEAPVLAHVPITRRGRRRQVWDGSLRFRESFRHLYMTTFGDGDPGAPKSITITSAENAEGKTTAASNLAVVTAYAGRSVLVIDADFRRPMLHRTFGVSNTVGLANVLSHEVPLDEAVQRTVFGGLHVLPTGPLVADSWQLLDSAEMCRIVERSKAEYDSIIIDTSAVNLVADPLSIARFVDRTLFVIACGRVATNEVQSALKQLSAVRAAPIGVVLNRVR